MGMSVDSGGDKNQVLAEINVTPLVDVMLVLLIIFMITSSVDAVRAEQELEELKQEVVEEEIVKVEEHPSQKVPVDLPKTNAEQVNLSQDKKMVLTLDTNWDFYVGDTRIVQCVALVNKPSTKDLSDQDFKLCLDALEQKLIDNEKIKADGELYLRADRSLDYGRVLSTMARVRKAGINKFGLVADADLEESK
ncbi:MAG: biopolymer transporter ExbD [Myxococcales bacterium]|nr:biopolymer transporter ExbD [Myxococcales bacterium]